MMEFAKLQALLERGLGDAWVQWTISGTRVLLIALAVVIAQRIASRLVRLFRERLSQGLDQREDLKRIETLARVFRYIASIVITLIGGLLMLSEFGISIAPILGAAGVVGLAVGFGAQSLVKDYFTGFFLLLENQIIKGDVVELAGKSGLVEDVTLRYVRLRNYDGDVHFVPNGEITSVTNKSRGFAFAVMDLGVAYREDLDEVYAVIRESAQKLQNDPAFSSRILEPIEIAGVESWADSAVVVRCRFKVVPLEQWAVRREFLKRLKGDFDAKGIEIPFPHLTIYAGVGKDGTAPSLPVDVDPQRT